MSSTTNTGAKRATSSSASNSADVSRAVAPKRGRKPAVAVPAPLVALPPAGKFDVLPMDCIRETLTFLDPTSLFNFSMTCLANGDRETTPEWL